VGLSPHFGDRGLFFVYSCPRFLGIVVRKDHFMNNKLINLFKSRKFWAALIGLALIIIKAFDEAFPLEEEQLTNVVYILVAYIAGVALENPSWMQKS